MSRSGSDRTRAERFADLVDDAGLSPRTHRRIGADEELAELARLVGGLRTLRFDAAPDPEFRRQLRDSLVATAARNGAGAHAGPAAPATPTTRTRATTPRWRRRASAAALAGRTQPITYVPRRGPGRARAALLVGVAAGALVLSGVSAASTGALPGEPLYTVKRSTEEAQLALAGSDTSRGKLYLDFARNRLAEARQVSDHGRIAGLLSDMDDDIRHGVALLFNAAVANHDNSALATVSTFVVEQRDGVDRLRGSLPLAMGETTAGPALTLLSDVQVRVGQLSTAIATPHCAIISVDPLGPVPASPC